jgi:hypothetical protein
MTGKTHHWYISSHGPDTEALRAALAWLGERARSSGTGSGLLVVSGKGNLEGTLETVLGRNAVSQLGKDNRVRIGGTTIELMTERIKRSSWAGPVLALYPTERLLGLIDGIRGVSDVLVVPWLAEEVVPWIRTWSARELGSTAEAPAPAFSNPTVRAALEALNDRVNRATGLAHPSDRAAAIEMFRLLRRARETFSPEEIRSWLLSQLSWQPRHADQVAEVAEKVLSGGRFRVTTSGGWAADAVQRWRQKGQTEPEGTP